MIGCRLRLKHLDLNDALGQNNLVLTLLNLLLKLAVKRPHCLNRRLAFRSIVFFTFLMTILALEAESATSQVPSAPIAGSLQSSEVRASLTLTKSDAKQAALNLKFNSDLQVSQIQLGRIAPGSISKTSVTLTNLSDSPIEFSGIKSSCSCVIIDSKSFVVAPKKTASIPIEIFASGFTGPLSESIEFTTSPPSSKSITAKIEGLVWTPISVEPQFLRLARPNHFNAARQTPSGPQSSVVQQYDGVIRITNLVQTPLQLSKPIAESKFFEADLFTNKVGKEFELRIRIVPPLPNANLYGRFILKTSLKEMPEIETTAFLEAVLPRSISPKNGNNP